MNLSSRFYHTVRHLKLRQVANRLFRKMRPVRRADAGKVNLVSVGTPWVIAARPRASLDSAGSVVFLNESGPLYEWRNPTKSHLWLYNLHYFDDLMAEHAEQRTELHREAIGQWLQDNPFGAAVAWEPYPTSLRIANWTKWILAGNEPVPGMLQSLFQQAHALSQQLEYHLLGNHILANAKALVFAGSCFEGEEAAGWLDKGLTLLDEQHREQLLPDGAHFELSPMYHAIILVDLLDVIQLGQCYRGGVIDRRVAVFRERATRMASWLRRMLHPDGEIAFFNDAAFGIAPTPHAILDYAASLGVTSPAVSESICHLDASGYVAVRRDEQVALLDVAPIGPDYIPGHAHADTLSFEWSLHGQRVFVNSGTSIYGVGDERLRQRGTAAHNTVVVNGENSSEVWSGFRVARRARPFGVLVDESAQSTVVRASHDGYMRLRPGVVHEREWRIAPGGLEVTDVLQGQYENAVAYYHLHPDIEVEITAQGLRLQLPSGKCCEFSIAGGELSVQESTWHPEFGVSRPSQAIAATFTAPRLKATLRY